VTTTEVRDAIPGGRSGTPLLRVRDLRVTFASRGRAPVRAVDGVSFDVAAGSTVGIVGESGSGKSVTSLAAMGLLGKRGVTVSGSVAFDGEDLLGMPEEELRSVRGREIAMVFQDPMSSLNPVLTIGRQITEILERHKGLKGRPPASARSTCCRASASATAPDGSRAIRTSCPAACASA
jgi:peptide/nickel transport system ATP-binding protein